jgi:hypothetical protein
VARGGDDDNENPDCPVAAYGVVDTLSPVYVAFDVLIAGGEDVGAEPSSFFKAREKTLLA